MEAATGMSLSVLHEMMLKCFPFFSWQNCFWMGTLCEQYFWSHSIGLRSGIWLGHYRMLTFLILSHSIVTSALCGRSAGRWIVSCALCSWDCSTISWRFFLHPSIFPSISMNFPVPVVTSIPKHNATSPCFKYNSAWDVMSFFNNGLYPFHSCQIQFNFWLPI